jgi:uncharacterized integral membrane protein (TIGR00697 family)
MKKEFKYFAPISMLFLVFALCDIISVYRLTTIGSLTIAAGIYILPFYYFLEDLIAEVYGYKRFRQTIWSMLIATFVFAFIITFIIHLPTPPLWPQNQAYLNVFSHLYRVVIGGGCIAVMSGAFINGYIISKWKILLRGRYFWIRSLGASAIGQAVQNVLGCLLLYTHLLPFNKVLQMMLPLYLIQISIFFLISIPGAYVVGLLKKLEGIEAFDQNVNFNPFKYAVQNEEIRDYKK